jgi:glycosyltransferase involved in cell wall biosynthesis
MPAVGIFRAVFPLPSETFISEQARSLLRYRPRLVVRRQVGPSPLPVAAPEPGPLAGLRDGLFAATASPRFYGARSALGDLDLLHAHFGPDGVYAMHLARAAGLPFLVTFHGSDITATDLTLARSLRPYNLRYLLERSALQREARAFLAVSRFIQERLLAKGYPEDRIIQHYLGVDTTRFVPAHAQAERPYLLCVARHVPVKGLDLLLEAFARVAPVCPGVDLLQVGDGPLAGPLRAQARALGLAGRVRFLGARPHAEVLALMQKAWAFVLPSRSTAEGHAEGLGQVFLEAAACACPVIATWSGGIPEAVLHGETGLLAPEGEVEGLAGLLRAILEDGGLAQELGRRGRERVCDAFDLARQTTKLELIYDQVRGVS